LPRNGRGHDGCPSVFIAPSSLYGARIFNDGIAFDNRWCNEQDTSTRLVWNMLSKCWDGMKGRHNSSTESGMGRRVTSMKALNLNIFLSCRLLSRRPTQCCLVPLLCRPSPCHPSPSLCHPLLSLCPPCHATPCCTTRPSLVMPPSLMLHCASLVLAGCCIALSLVAPTSLSHRMVVESLPLLPHRHLSHCTTTSLIMPPLSLHAVPLISRCASLIVPLLCQ
jgi:hypothetical protein